MRNVILNNLKEGIESNLGRDSSYKTDKVEDVQVRLPESILVNSFIGLTIDRAQILNQEIGKYHPSNNEYLCSIIVRIRNADYNDGQTELDTVVRRLIKYLSLDSGSLNGLESSDDDITETVISYNINDFDYVSGKARDKNGLIHICMVNISVKTQLNI